MTKTNVREIFGLPDDEEIFDDFSCKEGMVQGRMYLTQNHLCYFSNFLGKQKKINIKWKTINNFAKDGKNAIKITRRGNVPDMTFKEF